MLFIDIMNYEKQKQNQSREIFISKVKESALRN